MKNEFNTIDEAIDEIKNGKVIIVVDDTFVDVVADVGRLPKN